MKRCVLCKELAEVLSWQKLCNRCWMSIIENAVEQIREKKGPVYEKWVAKLGLRKISSHYIQTTLLPLAQRLDYENLRYRLGDTCTSVMGAVRY
jgi:hypothetical protein